jgi:4-diphosphocytidyl-2-C-methyl-D-erythritol kinase
MSSVSLSAPAKINLFLEILSKREDGYHNIESVLQTVNLFDEITLTKTRSGIKVFPSYSYLQPNEEDLTQRAAKVIFRAHGIKSGLEIKINKKIPVGAGLGGGSSDAAAVLRGINELFDLGLTKSSLLKLAQEIGSDVPFFIQGGTALVRARGEIISPLPPLKKGQFILIVPPLRISTQWAYQNYSFWSPRRKNIQPFLSALRKEALDEIGKLLYNAFEKLIIDNYPQVAQIKKELEKNRFLLGSSLTGSGPCIFGLVKTVAHANEILTSLQVKRYQSYHLQPLN